MDDNINDLNNENHAPEISNDQNSVIDKETSPVEMSPDSDSRVIADGHETPEQPDESQSDDSEILKSLGALQAELETVHSNLAGMQTHISSLEERVVFIPPQVRNLGEKVNGLAISVGETRYRALLDRLLGIYDLVDHLERSAAATGDPAAADARRNYAVILAQLRQLLESNGLSEIPAEGEFFNPELHCSIERVPCEVQDKDKRVLDVISAGFRTDFEILRYAQVRVGYFSTPESSGSQGSVPQQSSSDHPTTELGKE